MRRLLFIPALILCGSSAGCATSLPTPTSDANPPPFSYHDHSTTPYPTRYAGVGNAPPVTRPPRASQNNPYPAATQPDQFLTLQPDIARPQYTTPVQANTPVGNPYDNRATPERVEVLNHADPLRDQSRLTLDRVDLNYPVPTTLHPVQTTPPDHLTPLPTGSVNNMDGPLPPSPGHR